MQISMESSDGLMWDTLKLKDKSARTAEQQPGERKGQRDLVRSLDTILDRVNEGDRDVLLPVIARYTNSRASPDLPLRLRTVQEAFTRFDALDQSLDAASNFRYFFGVMEAEERRELRSIRDGDRYVSPILSAVRRAVSTL